LNPSAEPAAALGTPYWRIEEPDKVTGIRELVARMWMASRPVAAIVREAAPWPALIIVVAQLASAAGTAAIILLLNDLLSALLDPGADFERLSAAWPTLLLLTAVFAARIGCDALAAIEKAKIGPKVRRRAEERLLDATLSVQLASYDNPAFYDQLQRARDRGVLHLETAVETMVQSMAAFLTVAGAFVGLALLHPLLPALMLCVALPAAWGAVAGARTQYEGMSRTVALDRQTDMYRELATCRSAAPEIRANQVQSFLRDRFGQSAKAVEDYVVGVRTREAKIVALGGALSALALIAAFLLLGLMIRSGAIALAAAGAAAVAMRSASASLGQLATSSHELFRKALYISDYQRFLDLASGQAAPPARSPAPASPRLIEIRDLSFRYPGEDSPWVLRDVSLAIRAGQTVALVGENGSGKTTLAKLIAGLYEPSQGSICWDGLDLRTLDPDSVADRISMVLQQPVKWPHSARSNVEIGRHSAGADITKLERVAGESGASDVIGSLPQGWETLLSREFAGGRDLSAGQWQRLAVARGLYRDAPIVIWDEPTAPLDARSELAAYESLRRMGRDRTVILITHRLTSVQGADQIFFLQRGRLTEAGTHKELIEVNGDYAKLFALQASLFAAAI
jgi:ABC-type multidrug transport system fused ATPase/permease subunit